VRRQRQDVHHKTALARANAVIAHEAVQTANLLQHHPLTKRP
jgi:hypothetical protein